eukprot:547423-Hanusia_phi.AAC.1
MLLAPATEAAEREEEGEEQAAASPAPSDVGGLLKDVDMRKLHFSDRGRRTLQQIIELVDSFPIDDVTNPEVLPPTLPSDSSLSPSLSPSLPPPPSLPSVIPC